MSQAAENEKLKLTASWINGVSLAIVGAGVVLPFLNHALRVSLVDSSTMTWLFIGCFSVALILHYVGLAVLGGIE